MSARVQQLVEVCTCHSVHPSTLTRSQYRELCDGPIVGTHGDVSWSEAKRRASEIVDGMGEISRPIVPAGHTLKGVSTLRRQPDGTLQWTKTDRKAESEAEAIERIAKMLNDRIKPREWTVPAPKKSLPDELLSVVVFGDPHIGMRAIAAEAGADWDLAKGVEIHKRAIDELIFDGPDSAHCVILDVGDTTHADSGKRATTKGTLVDVDGAHADCIAAAYDVFVYAVDRALQRHETVECVIVPGNHGKETSFAIAQMLRIHYRSEERVTIPIVRDAAWHRRFGKVLLASTHGDTLRSDKPLDLTLTMANRWPKDWGETAFRYWLCGHVHHLSKRTVQDDKEVPAAVVRTFRTLVPQDRWHNHEGYSAKQDARKIVYHRDKGQRSEHVVTAEFLAVAA